MLEKTTTMASKPNQLRVFFLPYLALGHMIPMVDAARLFARHGVDVTIIVTTICASHFKKSIDDDDAKSSNQIRIHTLHFPFAEVGLPEGVETFQTAISMEIFTSISQGIDMLRKPIEQLFYETKLDCISQIFHIMKESRKSVEKSYGILMNTFHELEGTYEKYCRSTLKKNTWSVGPVSLWVNRDIAEKVQRFNVDGDEETREIKDWLDSKERNFVLYVSFRSQNWFEAAQLIEIAHGLEDSGHSFIWVVRKKEEDDYGEDFPAGFEERMKESKRGFLIKNWAPQMLILDHPATGGMVTHCGWNSILEGVVAGLPMITWPLFGEHFFNKKC
ncbi:hypothetical protein UlMin_039186 [Ulmus minor]